MNNFFKFEEDILFEDTPIDPSMKLKFRAYGNTPWFNLDGYAYPQSDGSATIFKIENAILLPKGSYSLSLNRNLKGRGDSVFLVSKDGAKKKQIGNDSIQVEQQQFFDLIFELKSGYRYFEGDFWSERQEDYGKDYQIKVALISGGLYEREKKYAVWKGDINNDGKIDWEDFVLMNLFDFPWEVELEDADDMFRMDVNGDGWVGGLDNLTLERYLCGREKLYEVEFRERLPYTES